MCPDRGVARRSVKRRRVFRLRVKSDEPSFTRRFKVLGFLPTDPMPIELEWELQVLDALEQRTYDRLESLGVPTDQWNYYLGFNKRVWERRVKFDEATFALEKQILLYEYALRGLNPSVLDEIQPIAEDLAEDKLIGVIRPWEAWTLIFSEDWGYGDANYLIVFSEDWGYVEPPGMTLLYTEDWSA